MSNRLDPSSTRTPLAGLRDLLACPACGGQPLVGTDKGLACEACGHAYPALGGVPCLVTDRDERVRHWRTQATAFREMMGQACARIRADLARFDLLPRARQRLEGFLAANLTNTEQLLQLLGEAGLRPYDNAGDDLAAMVEQEIHRARGRLPLTHHYELLLRDWAWEAQTCPENADALARVSQALGDDPTLGRVLVLGAGAGRLAYDLHCRHQPQLTLTVDLDPLLVLAADRITFGEGLDLVEFPFAPDGEVWLHRQLRRPGPVPRDFVLMLADALHPPLVPGSFDTIVTAWFLDVVDVDAREVIGLVHRMLTPGGRWINMGPMLYPASRPPAQRYTREEIVELVQLGGFDVRGQALEEVRYLRSPASGHARLESVLTFTADKQHNLVVQTTEPPAWVLLPHLPVTLPRQTSPAKVGHPILRKALELVDGERSVDDIAKRLSEQGLIPAGVSACDATGALLLKLHQDLGSS